MRITFISPPADMSGGQRVIATYAERLHRRGHRVVIVAPPRRRFTTRDRLRSLLRKRRWLTYPKASHYQKIEVERHTLDRFRAVTDGDVPDADVVIATWWETAEWVAALAPSKGAKAYFIQGHEIFDHLRADRVRATWKLPLHKITISRWLIDLAHNHYGCQDVDLVPNSVDLNLFHAKTRVKQSRPTVGFLYNLHPVKGCEVSLGAFARLANMLPEVQVMAFGHEAIDPQRPLPPNAQYWREPPQDSIRDIYAKCDVWMCGSRSEGFHLPPLEAMACRCPVVSTRVGGPLDIINDGSNGYLVDIGDEAGLADRLHRVLTLPAQQWLEMSDAAYATAIKYTWDDATDLFERALTSAVEQRSGCELR